MRAKHAQRIEELKQVITELLGDEPDLVPQVDERWENNFTCRWCGLDYGPDTNDQLEPPKDLRCTSAVCVARKARQILKETN